MKVGTPALAAALLLPTAAAVAPRVRGRSSEIDVETSGGASRRSLQLLSGLLGSFNPLSCNSLLDTVPCTPWILGETFAGVVNIPCGTCVTMSGFTAGQTVTVGGLNVIGRLDFPEGTKVNVQTPHLFVQGKLSMQSTGPIGGTPDVKITMTGTDDQILIPEDENIGVCPLGGCNVGPKAIVVAGGQLDINAMDDTCPTWSYVENFANSGVPQPIGGDYPVAPLPPDGCSSSLLNATFDDPNLGKGGLDGWYGNLGAEERILAGSHDGSNCLHIDHRKHQFQGPFLNLRRSKHRVCLESGVEYFFSAKIKLTASPNHLGHVSECSQMGVNCPKLRYAYMRSDNAVKWKDLVKMTTNSPADGTWFDMYGSFTMEDEWVNSTNIFQILTISDVDLEMDVSLDDVKIFLPPAEGYPDPNNVCSSLIINGGANLLAGFTFPFESTLKDGGASKLQIVTENGNPFFRVPNRKKAHDTIVYSLPKGCLIGGVGSTYSFSARIRVNSDAPASPKVVVRTWKASGNPGFSFIAKTCPQTSSSIGWTTCTGEIIWKDSHTDNGNSPKVEVLFIIADNNDADVDFDDISLDFKSGVPTGGIILDPAITDQCYTAGAKVFIPSDDLMWDRTQVLTLSGVTGPGNVGVDETGALRLPVTVNEDPRLAGQFAFLSRKIEFDGDGGTLTVLGTSAVQKIQGVSIVGFGQEGILGRNPINFRLSDGTGSVIKKNSINKSKNRCIQVQGTNNLYIGENVAYDNKGHCYATVEGSETGNVFEKNIGALNGLATTPIGTETDHTDVATFYITSPGNSWIGNIAAGSQAMGFQFQLKQAVVGDTADINSGVIPYSVPIVAFDGNVAHSNFYHGIKTFPSGYNPLSTQTFTNCTAYRNRGQGIDLKGSRNIILDGGVVADNRNGIVLFKSDGIVIRNMEVIGQTQLYKSLALTVEGTPKLCGGRATSSSVGGIMFHPNKKQRTPGVTVENVSFSGFGVDSGCHPSKDDTAALTFVATDSTMEQAFTTSVELTGLTFEDGYLPTHELKLCAITAAGVTDIVLVDTDGSLNPNDSGAGTVISEGMTCSGILVDMPDSCAQYCEGGSVPAPSPGDSPTSPTTIYPSGSPDPSAVPTEVSSSICLTNGAFESGIDPWNGYKATVQLSMGYGDSGQGALARDRTHQPRGGLYQQFQTSCLTLDEWYELRADIRLMKKGTQTPFVCKPDIMWYNTAKTCAFLTLLVDSSTNDRIEVGAISGPLNTDGDAWNVAYGAFKATADIMNKATLQVMIASAPTDADIYIDNVALTSVTDISASVGAVDCAAPVVNGNFETGDLTGWFIRGRGEGGDLEVVAGVGDTGSAVRHINRPANPDGDDRRWHGILQKLPNYCFTVGSVWDIKAKFRYFDPSGEAKACFKNSTGAVEACPTFELASGGEIRSGPLVNFDPNPMTVGEWNDIHVNYTIIPAMPTYTGPGWRKMWLTINSVYAQHIYELDDIVMTRVSA